MEETGTIVTEVNFDISKVSIVDINELRPNSWNPKNLDTKEYQRVKASVEKNGLRGPIIVRENLLLSNEEQIPYEILDGEQRWRSCKDLGYTKVIIYNEGEISDQRAKELTIWYQQQVPFNEVKLAWLIKDLISEGNASVPYSSEEVDAYLKATEFDMNSFKKNNLNENNETPLTFAIKVSKSQYDVIKQAIAKFMEQNKTEGLTITETEAFVHIMNWWRRQDGGE